ncbi:hypothetical protein Bhyg_02557, partial [Pseudolycoriella hygida]
MYRRISKFLKLTHLHIASYTTLNYLFVADSKSQPNQTLLATLRNTLGFDGTFTDIKTEGKWWQHIPMLYRLQQWHGANGTKAFRIFPILAMKRHYASYDGQALWQFLRHSEISPGSYAQFRPIGDATWRDLFHIKEVESTNHRFGNNIRTDGTAYGNAKCYLKNSNKPKPHTRRDTIAFRAEARQYPYENKILDQPEKHSSEKDEVFLLPLRIQIIWCSNKNQPFVFS